MRKSLTRHLSVSIALLPLTLGCQLVSTPAPVSISASSSTLLVPVAPNTAGATQAAATFGASTTETLAYGNPYRIRTTGTVAALQFNFHPGTSVSHLYVRFWTQTASNNNSFTLNCSTEDLLSDSLIAGLNTVTLHAPCSVTAGDFWSVYLVNTAGNPLDTLRDPYSYSFTDTSSFASIGDTAHVFTAAASTGAAIPAILNLYENAYPVLAVAGDSELDGWSGLGNGMADFWEKYLPVAAAFPNFLSTTLANQMPNSVAQAKGWTLADYAEAGSVSARISTVFTTIVAPLHPKVAIVGLTSNDMIQNLWNAQAYLANYTAIARAAQSAGIKLVLTSTPSVASDGPVMAAELDVANAYGPALCAAYGCTWVDTRPTVDLPQPGAYSGNLWNINPAFYFGDGLHLNAVGQQAVANLVLNALGDYQP